MGAVLAASVASSDMANDTETWCDSDKGLERQFRILVTAGGDGTMAAWWMTG